MISGYPNPLLVDFQVVLSYNRISLIQEEIPMRCMMDGCQQEAEETSKFCQDHLTQVQYAYRGKDKSENPWANIKCSVDDCESKTKTSTCRFCAKHYTRFFRHGDASTLNRPEWRSQCQIKGCMGLAVGHGYCSKHYQRFMKYGDPVVDNSNGEKCNKFIRDVVLPYSEDDCLVWPFYRDPDGYPGKIRWNSKIPESACRVVCKIVHGDPPSESSQAAHNCGRGNLGCINPNHLQW